MRHQYSRSQYGRHQYRRHQYSDAFPSARNSSIFCAAHSFIAAMHGGWMEFGSAVLNDIWGFYTAPDAAAFEAKAKSLTEKFARLEAVLGERPDSGGPYFAGAAFSLVDACFAPVFRYFDAFDRIGDFGILADCPRIAAWRAALARRPSVAAAVAPDFQPRLEDFFRARRGFLSTLMTQEAA